MIFVVEQYFKTRQAKIVAWERARDKWVNEDTEKYYYRSNERYEREHPYPVFKWKPFLATVLPIVVAGIVAASLIAIFISSDSNNGKDDKSKTSTSQQKKPVKTDYKVGDKVQVVYGDYKDSVGVIVKVDDDGAIIKLTNSTWTAKMADAADRSGGMDNGALLSIGSLKNLVPYTDTKK